MADSMRSIMISKLDATGNSPSRWAVGRSQAINAIASSFFAKHPGHPASEFEALFCIDVLDVVFSQRFIRK
jgi:hypothetical protein